MPATAARQCSPSPTLAERHDAAHSEGHSLGHEAHTTRIGAMLSLVWSGTLWVLCAWYDEALTRLAGASPASIEDIDAGLATADWARLVERQRGFEDAVSLGDWVCRRQVSAEHHSFGRWIYEAEQLGAEIPEVHQMPSHRQPSEWLEELTGYPLESAPPGGELRYSPLQEYAIKSIPF